MFCIGEIIGCFVSSFRDFPHSLVSLNFPWPYIESMCTVIFEWYIFIVTETKTKTKALLLEDWVLMLSWWFTLGCLHCQYAKQGYVSRWYWLQRAEKVSHIILIKNYIMVISVMKLKESVTFSRRTPRFHNKQFGNPRHNFSTTDISFMTDLPLWCLSYELCQHLNWDLVCQFWRLRRNLTLANGASYFRVTWINDTCVGGMSFTWVAEWLSHRRGFPGDPHVAPWLGCVCLR